MKAGQYFMKHKRKFKKLFYVLFLPAGILMSHICSLMPEFVEKKYSQGIYKPVGQFLSSITGFLPVSLGELIVIFIVTFALWKLVILIRIVFLDPPRRRSAATNFLENALVFISIIYFCFNITWGLNYYRLPFSKIAGLDTRPASVSELEEVCENLILRANDLRSRVPENNDGIMQTLSGNNDVLERAYKGYEVLSPIYPELGGKYGRPKGVILSKLMCYTGITGVYFPFTGEANVNTAIPDSMLSSTVTHEMAHQRGFAREDEANYIAYLACTAHPDMDFQYSGVLLALIHSMNALYSYDQEGYERLYTMYSSGLKKDLKYNSEFWQQYEGAIEEISNDINNAYLKANRQKEGVYSYGRMVDLLIAEHRKNKKTRCFHRASGLLLCKEIHKECNYTCIKEVNKQTSYKRYYEERSWSYTILSCKGLHVSHGIRSCTHSKSTVA